MSRNCHSVTSRHVSHVFSKRLRKIYFKEILRKGERKFALHEEHSKNTLRSFSFRFRKNQIKMECLITNHFTQTIYHDANICA